MSPTSSVVGSTVGLLMTGAALGCSLTTVGVNIEGVELPGAFVAFSVGLLVVGDALGLPSPAVGPVVDGEGDGPPDGPNVGPGEG